MKRVSVILLFVFLFTIGTFTSTFTFAQESSSETVYKETTQVVVDSGQPINITHYVHLIQDLDDNKMSSAQNLPEKSYYLQVGAYLYQKNASVSLQKLKNSGLNAVQEHYGDLYRVSVAGIAEKDVNTVTLRLKEIGFSDIWVRE